MLSGTSVEPDVPLNVYVPSLVWLSTVTFQLTVFEPALNALHSKWARAQVTSTVPLWAEAEAGTASATSTSAPTAFNIFIRPPPGQPPPPAHPSLVWGRYPVGPDCPLSFSTRRRARRSGPGGFCAQHFPKSAT